MAKNKKSDKLVINDPLNLLKGVDPTSITPDQFKALVTAETNPGLFATGRRDFGRLTDLDASQYGSLIEDEDGRITATPESWQDLASQNQGTATKLAKGVYRFANSAALKTVQGLGLMGSAAIAGLAEAGQALSNATSPEERQSDIDFFTLENITNNAIVNELFATEERFKESEAAKIYKPSDWDSRSIWEQVLTADFIADELADGAAFMASSWLQATMTGGLGMGAALARNATTGAASTRGILNSVAANTFKKGGMGSSLASRMIGKVTAKNIGKGLDFLTNTAMMTANESLFEARDIGVQMQTKALNDYFNTLPPEELDALGIQDASQLSPEEQKEFLSQLPEEARNEILEKKGRAVANTFGANMGALMFSNAVELATLNKFIGKGYRNILGKSPKSSIGTSGNILDNVENLSATAKRFWQKGSPVGAVLGGLGKNMAAEGLWEENIQNSIQNISMTFDGEGAIDYMSEVFGDMVSNTVSGDKDAWKSIVSGAIIGGISGGVGGYKGWKDDKTRVAKAVKSINSMTDNAKNILNSLYVKNEDGTVKLENGEPVVDGESVLNYIKNSKQIEDLASLQDIYREAGANEIADLLRNEILTKLALSYVESGLESQLEERLKTLDGLSEEQLAMLGMEQELNETTEEKQAQVAKAKTSFKSIANNVINDYKRFKKVIPESNQAALNQAVKYSTRVKGINDLLAEKETEILNLKNSEGSFSINDINFRTRRIKKLQASLKTINQNTEPRVYALVQDKIKKETEALTEFKESRAENIWNEKTIKVPKSVDYIREEAVTEAFKKDLNSLATKQVELEISKEQQLDRLNDILENPDSFTQKLVERLNYNAQTNEEKVKMEEEIKNLQPGDRVEMTDENGNTETFQIRVNPGGRGLVAVANLADTNTAIHTTELSNSFRNIKKLNETEVAEFEQTERVNFRNSQLRRRIQIVKDNILNLRNKYSKALSKIEDVNKKLDVLRDKLSKATYDTTEQELNREIEAVEEALYASQEEANNLKDLISERYDHIDRMENEILEGSVDTNVENLRNRVERSRESIKELEEELGNETSFLQGMIEVYNYYKEIWNRFFPDKQRTFREIPETADALIEEYVRVEEDEMAFGTPRDERGRFRKATEEERAEFTNVRIEHENNKQEVKARIKNLEAVKKQKENLQRKLKLYERELAEFELLLYNQENFGETQAETTGNNTTGPTPAKGGTPIKSEKDFEKGARKDINGGLMTTTGNFNVHSPQSDAWFKFTESAHDMSQYRLAVVTINDPVFGLGKQHDVFSHEPKEHQTEDNVKVVVINEGTVEGQSVSPFKMGGQLISTSLIEVQDKFEDFKFTSGKQMFTNALKLKEADLNQEIEKYKQFIKEVKEESASGNRRVLAIGGRSIGFIVKPTNSSGKRIDPSPITARQAFGRNNPRVQVSTNESYMIKGVAARTELGAAYVYHQSGSPIPATVRNINEQEAKSLLDLLKQAASNRLKKVSAKEIIDKIESTLYLGKAEKSPQHSTYFVRGANSFVFGGNLISIEDLASGKFDSALLEHLSKQRHQVNVNMLKTDTPFTSVTGEKFDNYNSYLVGENGRDLADIPLTFEILPRSADISQHQIGGVYFTFDPNVRNPTKKVKPQPSASTPPPSTPAGNNTGITLDVDTMSDMNAAGLAMAQNESSKTEAQRKKEKADLVAKNEKQVPVELRDELAALRGEVASAADNTPTSPETIDEVEDSKAALMARLRAKGATKVGKDVGVVSPEAEAVENVENVEIADNSYVDGFRPISNDVAKDVIDETPKSLPASVVKKYEKGSLKEEVKALRKILGNNNLLTIVQGLIDGKDFGQVLPSGRVILSDLLARGTAYHEAFHVVFDFMLNEAERANIYKEYREANPQFENKSNLAIEEAIAEEFREYALSKQSTSTLKRIFDSIIDFVLSVFNLQSNQEARTAKNKLFKEMLAGKYNNKAQAIKNNSIKSMSFLDEGNTIANSYDTATQRAIFEGMSYDLMERLRENGYDFEDLDSYQQRRVDKDSADAFNSIFEKILNNVILTILDNNPTSASVTDLAFFLDDNSTDVIRDFQKYIERFKIITREDVEGQVPLEESDKSKDTLGIIDAIEFDPKTSTPNIIKLILSSLPSYVNGVEQKNHLGLPRLADFRTTIASLFNELSGLETLNEMRSKLFEMSKDQPQYEMLLDALGIPKSGDIRTTDLSPSQVMLQNKFRETFDKAYYNFNIHKYNEGGDSYITPGNADRMESVIRERWRSNFINLPSGFKKFVNGYEVFNGNAYLSKYPQLSAFNILDFYKDLGIEFSKPEKVSKEVLLKEAPEIISRLSEVNTNDLFSDELGIRGWLSSFIREEMDNSINTADNQHISSEGKTVYSISLNNMLTIAARKINNLFKGEKAKADTRDASYLLWDENTLTGNAFARNSVALRNKWKVKVEILEGANAEQQDIDGQKTSKLSRTDTIVQQIVSLLDTKERNKGSLFPFLRQADRGIEYGISFTNADGTPVKVSSIESIAEWDNILKGYLADELLTSFMLNVENVGSNVMYYKDNAKDLRIFKGLFKPDSLLHKRYQNIINGEKSRKQAIDQIEKFVNHPEVISALQTLMETYNNSVIAELERSNIVTKIGDEYKNSLLPESIVPKELMTLENLQNHIRPFTRGFFLGNMEQAKLFTGDLAYYKQSGNKVDFFKRTSGLGGTGRTLTNDMRYLEVMDEISPRTDKRRSQDISSWVFNDVKATSNLYSKYLKHFSKKYGKEAAAKMLRAYKGYEEADAQGYISIHAYKDMLERAGQWTDVQESIYRDKLVNSLPLSESEFLSFPPLKPQYFGPQVGETNGAYIPTFYKLSLMPLIPSAVQNKTLDNLRKDMEANGIDLATFVTGNKVGNTGASDFYNANGAYNTGEKRNIQLDWDFMKIQLDMSPETKTKVTFGTQFRKLVLSNILGKKLYEKKDKNGNTTDRTQELFTKYNNLIKELTSLEMEGLIKRLDVKFSEEGATLNVANLAQMLRDDAFKNNAPKNVIDDINHILQDFDYTNNTYVEAMISRRRMETLLMGMVNDGVIRNKMFGDMFVQASVTGFESGKRAKVVSDSDWYSDGTTLQFYDFDDSGTKAMEVLLPHRFKEMYGKNIEYANIDPRLLEIIGFRIPTQGLNSIEVIKIKGFLPKEAGNTIIMPSEIVAKAGSDFDIDKLTAFLNNYSIKRDYTRLQKDFYNQSDQRIKNYLEVHGPNSLQYLENIVKRHGEENLYPAQQNVYENLQIFLMETTEDYNSRIEYVEYNPERPTVEGVQNEIIKTAREIIMAPENFEDLIRPISAEILQEQANQISNLKGLNNTEVSYADYFDFGYLQTTREDFLTGKDGVAIAALNLVHHTMSQQADLSLRTSPLIKEETEGVTEELTEAYSDINLPVNRNPDGSISFAGITDSNGANNILDTISAFLNGFVDIAKDPFLKVMNATSDTANTYLMLIRAGVPVGLAARFMNQPIIIDYVNSLKINNSISVEVNGNRASRAELRKRIESAYPSAGVVTSTEDLANFLKSASKMESAIKGEERESAEYNSMQQEVLNQYLEYERIANNLSDLMRATNADTAGAGGSLFIAQDYLERYEEIKNNSMFNNVERFETDTFLGGFNDAIRQTLEMYNPLYKFLRSDFAMEALGTIKSRVKEGSPRIASDRLEKILNLAENELIIYAIENSVNEKGLTMASYIERLFKGPNSIPKKIATIKQTNPNLANNLLIKELTVKLSNLRLDDGTADAFDNLTTFSKRLPKEAADDLISAWEELYSMDENLANQLFDFALVQSSLNRSTSEFLKYAPTRFTAERLNRYIDLGLMANLEVADFVNKFYRNNAKNKELVPKTWTRIYEKGRGRISAIQEATKTLKSVINRPFVKTWHKDKSKGYYFRLWENSGDTQGKWNLYEEVPVLDVDGKFKYYGPGVMVRGVIPEVRQKMKQLEEEAARNPKTLEEKKAAFSDSITRSDLTPSRKNHLRQRLNQVRNEDELASFNQILCNLTGK